MRKMGDTFLTHELYLTGGRAGVAESTQVPHS